MTPRFPRPLLACLAGLALAGCVYAEPVVAPAPAYVAPAPAVVAPPPVIVRPAPPPVIVAPRRVWVPGHYNRWGHWVPGHWR